jgi:serine/threonine protein kinase
MRAAMDELRNLKALRHPQIIRYERYHNFEWEKTLSIYMEYCPGGNLWTYIQNAHTDITKLYVLSYEIMLNEKLRFTWSQQQEASQQTYLLRNLTPAHKCSEISALGEHSGVTSRYQAK